MIACANTVAENMGIRTTSKLTEEARRGVLEFLLSNHPLDCPICDQAGECKLQEYTTDYGSGTHRFTEEKTKKGKKAIKLTWSGTDVVFDGVEFQRSLKKNSGYGKKPFFTTKEGAESYTNTSVKKGTRYYYRARGFVTIDGEKVYTKWSTKAWRKIK